MLTLRICPFFLTTSIAIAGLASPLLKVGVAHAGQETFGTGTAPPNEADQEPPTPRPTAEPVSPPETPADWSPRLRPSGQDATTTNESERTSTKGCHWTTDSAEPGLDPYQVEVCGTSMLGTESMLGASWQAAVLQGATKFAVQRSREEVIQWFLDEAARQVCEDQQYAFPNICSLAEFSDTSIPSRQAFVAALRDDLRLVVPRLMKPATEQEVGGAYAWVHAATATTRALMNGRSVAQALTGIAGNPNNKEKTPAARACASGDASACGLMLVSLTAQSYVEKEDKGRAPLAALVRLCSDIGSSAPSEQLKEHCKTVNQVQMIGGRLPKDITPAEKVILEEVRDNLQLDSIINSIEALDAAIGRIDQNLLALAGEEATRSKAIALSLSALQVLQTGAMATEKIDPIVATFAEAALLFSNGDYDRGVVILASALSASDRKLPNSIELPGVLLNFLPLFVDLAEASSSEEVESALTAAVSPVGAWRMKTKATVVSLGALVGVEGGYQWAIPEQTVRPIENGWHLGLSIPMGIEFTTPIAKAADKAGGSFGVFIPIVNVGRLVDATFPRSVNDAASGEVVEVRDAALSFRQVLSPGLLLRFGLGRTPFVFATGAYWAPSEREAEILSAAERSTSNLNAWRVTASLSVDVTFFPFAVHRKKKQ